MILIIFIVIKIYSIYSIINRKKIILKQLNNYKNSINKNIF